MYCKNCGNSLNGNPTFCPNCGAPTGQTAQASQPTPPAQSTTNGIAIVGFILSFFIGIPGLICSIIGCRRSAKCNGNGKGLSIAGIVISSIRITAIFLVILFYILAFMGLFAIAAAWGAGAG